MLIGRKKELAKLKSIANSDKSEFVAVYGRRRVGKTYLIREAFNYKFAFHHSGLAKGGMKEQLEEFYTSLRNAGYSGKAVPKNWFEAFNQLASILAENIENKKIVFIDEMPWLDTVRSNFISALEHFWNGWASARKDIVLIVCGSATSWIMDKIILDYGGLHNRLTQRILVSPFTLGECEKFAEAMDIVLDRKSLVEAYMIMGGIPYYWSFLQRGQSLAQNIDRLFFSQNGELFLEFMALYASLFKNAKLHTQIVAALGNAGSGLTRDEILKKSRLTDNSKFDTALRELEYCGFVRKYNPIDKKKKTMLFQLIDNYTLFYYRYIADNPNNDEHFWSTELSSSRHSAWAGLAFERVCMQHIPQIKNALGINSVLTNVYSFVAKKTDEHEGAQIDMLIDRGDNIINICEARFSSEPYIVSAKDEADLLRRKSVFKTVTGFSKSLHLTLLTTYPPVENAHLHIMQNVVTMDDLFEG